MDGGAERNACRRRRRRFRGGRLRAQAGVGQGRPGHAHRPERLPPVPAAAVPGRDVACSRRGDIAYPLRKIAARVRRLRREARRRRRHRPGRAHRHDDDRRDLHRGLPRPRGRARSRTSSGRPGAEHAFPLYSLDDARSAPDADHPGVRGGRPRPALRRRGRHRLRRRRRRPDRRRGRRRPVRDDRHDDGARIPGACAAKAKVHLVDHGHALLGMFADKAHAYAARGAREGRRRAPDGDRRQGIGPGHVTLSDGTTIKTRCVIWGGGLMAAPIAGDQRAAAGARRPDRRAARLHGRRVSRASSSSATSRTSRPRMARRIPQLGSVALQSGSCGREDDPRRSPEEAAPSRSPTSTRARWR